MPGQSLWEFTKQAKDWLLNKGHEADHLLMGVPQGRVDNIPLVTLRPYPSLVGLTGITVNSGPSIDTNSNSLYGWSWLTVTDLAKANAVQLDFLYPFKLPAKSSMHFTITDVQGKPIYWDSDTYQGPAFQGFKMHTVGGSGAFPSLGDYYYIYTLFPAI